jgi:hypothetical protein
MSTKINTTETVEEQALREFVEAAHRVGGMFVRTETALTLVQLTGAPSVADQVALVGEDQINIDTFPNDDRAAGFIDGLTAAEFGETAFKIDEPLALIDKAGDAVVAVLWLVYDGSDNHVLKAHE